MRGRMGWGREMQGWRETRRREKASRLDQEPAGQTEGNESLDGPRRAVRGAGVPEGRGGRVSAGSELSARRGLGLGCPPPAAGSETAAGWRADGGASLLGARVRGRGRGYS